MHKIIHSKILKAVLMVLFGIILICTICWMVWIRILNKVSFEGQNNINFKDAKTEVSLNNQNIPNDFPQNFPIYPKTKITSSWKSEQNDLQGFSLVMESTDGLKEVASFYASELPKNGWTVEESIKEVNSTTLSFNKDESKGFIGLVESGGRVIISLSLGVTK